MPKKRMFPPGTIKEIRSKVMKRAMAKVKEKNKKYFEQLSQKMKEIRRELGSPVGLGEAIQEAWVEIKSEYGVAK